MRTGTGGVGALRGNYVGSCSVLRRPVGAMRGRLLKPAAAYVADKPGNAVLASFHDCGDEVIHEGLRRAAIVYPGYCCAIEKLPVAPFLAQLVLFGRQDQ